MIKLITTALAVCTMTLSVSSVSAKPFKHKFGEWREYNSAWLAVCPEKLEPEKAKYSTYYDHCWAVAGSKQKNSIGYPVYSFRIHRHRVTGKFQVSFTYAGEKTDKLDLSRPMDMYFDGSNETRLSFSTSLETRFNTVNEYFIKNETQKDLVVKNLRERSHLTVSIPLITAQGEAHSKTVNIWLKGVQASEKFMKAYANASQ
ncbi:MAG: hypothetical protein ABJK39_10160 [Hyphomicrobiales bacterium]